MYITPFVDKVCEQCSKETAHVHLAMTLTLTQLVTHLRGLALVATRLVQSADPATALPESGCMACRMARAAYVLLATCAAAPPGDCPGLSCFKLFRGWDWSLSPRG